MDLSTLIKCARLKNKMKQKEFAKFLNVSAASVSKYERGISKPTSDVLLKILSIDDAFVSSKKLNDKIKCLLQDIEIIEEKITELEKENKRLLNNNIKLKKENKRQKRNSKNKDKYIRNLNKKMNRIIAIYNKYQ